MLVMGSLSSPPGGNITVAITVCSARPALQEACSGSPVEIGTGETKVTLRCEVVGDKCKANQQDVGYYQDLLKPQIQAFKDRQFWNSFYSLYLPALIEILVSIFLFLKIRKINILKQIYAVKIILSVKSFLFFGVLTFFPSSTIPFLEWIILFSGQFILLQQIGQPILTGVGLLPKFEKQEFIKTGMIGLLLVELLSLLVFFTYLNTSFF